ncbi:hypothetical protein L195_g042673 [Trifolium pratense]|uniref:Uncharacterized protein n=1 Tax=Trifolium pratense TaxID=57577 RepID=A0A2K3K1P6_TRIPR|nr:hypothetical protein L195_g059385 [Trifolium pratense]PNX60208.1 hypothetical protein L195_g060072 [Trifolium pratense]PNX86594.1 hypothetical protein L195_g042673 [Trifolium pratense]
MRELCDKKQRRIDYVIDLRLNGGAPECDVEVQYGGSEAVSGSHFSRRE